MCARASTQLRTLRPPFWSSPMSNVVTSQFQLPTRLIYQFKRIKMRPYGREESNYGPIDKLLNTIFCKEAHMVKPQGPIKEEAVTLEVEESFNNSRASITANTLKTSKGSVISTSSNNSYGAKIETKVTKFPDFIVCEYSPGATEDKPILLVEVKKRAEQLEYGIEELQDYIDIMGSQLKTDLCCAHGVVIAGHCVAIFAPSDENTLRFKQVETFSKDLSVIDDAFLTYLYQRASLRSDV